MEDELEKMSLSEHSNDELEDHVMDLMYGGTRFENKLLTKKIVY